MLFEVDILVHESVDVDGASSRNCEIRQMIMRTNMSKHNVYAEENP